MPLPRCVVASYQGTGTAATGGYCVFTGHAPLNPVTISSPRRPQPCLAPVRLSPQVSTLIAGLYNRCALGLLDEARSLLHSVITAAAAKAASKARTNDSSDDDDEDGSGEEGEEGAGGDGSGAGGSGRGPRRVVDEDGWETIVPKGGKGAKPAPTAAPAGGAGTGGSSDASASGGEGGAGAGAAMDVDR